MIGTTDIYLVVKFIFNNWPLKPPKTITHLNEKYFLRWISIHNSIISFLPYDNINL